jgi:hypothetical protein
MNDTPASLTPQPEGYASWLGDIKAQIHEAQLRASQALNQELIRLYWRIGRAILDQQEQQGWGAKVIDRLAHDLRANFPEMKGFSSRNLKYMRAFAEAWPEEGFVQQPAGQLEQGGIVQGLPAQNEEKKLSNRLLDYLCKRACTNCLGITTSPYWTSSRQRKSGCGMRPKRSNTTGRATFW